MEQVRESSTLEDFSVDDIFSALDAYQQETPCLTKEDLEIQFTQASKEAEELAQSIGDVGSTLIQEVEAFLQSEEAAGLAALQSGLRDRMASGDLCCSTGQSTAAEDKPQATVTAQTNSGYSQSYEQAARGYRKNRKQNSKKRPGGWCAGFLSIICFVDLS